MRVEFTVTCDTEDKSVFYAVLQDGTVIFKKDVKDAITGLRAMADTCEKVISRIQRVPNATE